MVVKINLISMNNNQLWQSVLGEIELSLSKANFTTWFKNTYISSYEDGRVVICVPNTFTQAWLEKKYHQQIKSAIENIKNEKIKDIYYKVETKKIVEAAVEEVAQVKVKKNSESGDDIAVGTVNWFGLNTKYQFENFIVGRGNELAHAAAHAVAANPGKAYNPLFIYGGVGLGKTHLLQAIGHEVMKSTDRILYVTCEKFTNDYIYAVKTGHAKEFKEKYRNVDLLLIDDIQFMAGKDGTQEEFFHTFNELHQTNRQIVITSDRPPKSIPALEKRLLSRFEWGMIADVSSPDVETRMAILQAKCREKNYPLDQEIIYFIANNIQANIRELEGALNRLIVFHEFNNTKPTIDSTRNVLENVIASTKSKSMTCKNIIEAVCNYFDVPIKDLTGASRKKELVYPRQVSMYLMRKLLNSSYPTIGDELGGRDHTTAMHAFNKMLKEIEANEKTKRDVDSIKQIVLQH